MHLASGRIVLSSDAIRFPRSFNYGQNTEFLKLFVMSWLKMLDDSPLSQRGGGKPLKVYYQFLDKLLTEPILDTIKAFAALSDMILQGEYVSGSDSSTRVFYDQMRDTPIFFECVSWINSGDPRVLTYVLSFLRFGKKLSYQDDSLHAVAFRQWLEVEERLRTLVFSEVDLMSLKNIISALLPNYPKDIPIATKFGSGKVSEKEIRDVYDKLGSLSLTSKIRYAYYRDGLSSFSDVGRGPKWAPASTIGSSEISRLRFVEKDITKARSICMEPNIVMLHQQDVLKHLVVALDRGRIRQFVNLADQTRNQKMALHGSMYASLDTIDLSSASDCVHTDLVRNVFPNDYLYYLMATRTSKVLKPDGEVVTVSKFAPMGSAVCFPVQCILFTAITLYAYLAVERDETTGSFTASRQEVVDLIDNLMYKEVGGHTPFKRKYEPPVVYGDDIICDSRVTDEVMLLLDRLGFVVNKAKSFTGSQSFRESCGVYCCEGEDVTPVLFRVSRFKRGRIDSKVYASIISSINNFGDRGYHGLQSFWLSVLKGMALRYPIPFTEDRLAFGIFTRSKHEVPDKFLRWNADWQIYEELVQGIGAIPLRKSKPENLDDYRWSQWWRSRMGNDSTLLSEERLLVRPQETRLAALWARSDK